MSDLGVGDVEQPYVVVTPADTDTAATLTVTSPSGVSTPITASGGPLESVSGSADFQQTWTADQPVVYSAPGRWVLHWDVTGTGESAEDYEVWVVASPTAGGPTWTPGRSRVAAYVPHRTLARDLSTITGSADQYQFTFDSTTTPPGASVDRLIADAVARVSARVSPMQASMFDLAAAVSALLAAVWVERSWPHDDDSLQRARDMQEQADAMLTELVKANAAAGSTGEYGIDVMPAWSFPVADMRYDDGGYW